MQGKTSAGQDAAVTDTVKCAQAADGACLQAQLGRDFDGLASGRALCTSASAAASSPALQSSTPSALANRRQLTAMLIAVSCLSPVIIQTLMPAASSVAMLSGTCACSLSSTADTPTSSRSRSISSRHCTRVCHQRPASRGRAGAVQAVLARHRVEVVEEHA
jgi:hypothetical protein